MHEVSRFGDPGNADLRIGGQRGVSHKMPVEPGGLAEQVRMMEGSAADSRPRVRAIRGPSLAEEQRLRGRHPCFAIKTSWGCSGSWAACRASPASPPCT